MEQPATPSVPSVTPGYRGARESSDTMDIRTRIAFLVLAMGTTIMTLASSICEDEPDDEFAVTEIDEGMQDAGIEE